MFPHSTGPAVPVNAFPVAVNAVVRVHVHSVYMTVSHAQRRIRILCRTYDDVGEVLWRQSDRTACMCALATYML